MPVKRLLFGKAKSLSDHKLFHQLWLGAIFAWVGLGADGLSSSCYGPEEAFKALGEHNHLSLLVAGMTIVTIVVICASYSQIIGLFPSGGGGYLVASKLLSPTAGLVSGSALLIDYVLTITLSVASGADALFSLLPPSLMIWKLPFAFAGLLFLTIANMRGVKESVMLWAPVFFTFIATHVLAIGYAAWTHAGSLGAVGHGINADLHGVSSGLGVFGLLALLLKAYSMGAGTFTGIEAVSNGLPILQEPRVQTGRKTMLYMGLSLALMVGGLMFAYLLCEVHPAEGKTLNAVLFEGLCADWGTAGKVFLAVTLCSEALLLLIAAQTGFLDGPRVLANMALDRWFPTRFANLSDRFVTQNGVLLMAAAAGLMMAFTAGVVDKLIVFYSINVFITFSLSQAGMVRHWWAVRGQEPRWLRRLTVNAAGLLLTGFILVMLIVEKFSEGAWLTLVITGTLAIAASAIRRHYDATRASLARLDLIKEACELEHADGRGTGPCAAVDHKARTAIVLVNGYNGLGLHTLTNIPRLFGDTYRNFVFVEAGMVDAGNFKGADEIAALRRHTADEAERYARLARARGYGAEACTDITHDAATGILKLAEEVSERYPNRVFFAGQLVFERETRLTRWLHNHLVFNLQRRFFLAGIPFVIVPIRVEA
jgi:hypothetical protein